MTFAEFNYTIMENVRPCRKDATDEEFLEAARLENCAEFAEKLPDKWKTNIGENGSELSVGERQRTSIARAFLKNAPIILLDKYSTPKLTICQGEAKKHDEYLEKVLTNRSNNAIITLTKLIGIVGYALKPRTQFQKDD